MNKIKVFDENGLKKHDVQHKWHYFEQYNLGEKIEKILNEAEESDKDQEWFLIVENIQERFKERFKGWWEDYGKFMRLKKCIICNKEPNCLNQYNLSKMETKAKLSVKCFTEQPLNSKAASLQ